MRMGSGISELSMPLKTKSLPSLPCKKSPVRTSLHERKHKSLSIRAVAANNFTLDVKDRRADVVRGIEESLSLSNCLSETHLDKTVPGVGSKIRGKVRDIYSAGDYLILVTTDRQSAFDRVLASVPFKGQVLNQTSLWWFNNTKDMVPNAVVSSPDLNVTIAKKCSVYPVEFVVRGFVTGTTSTSLWTVYSKGVRNYCGNVLPDGLAKNQRLEKNILTPTTKAADHDVPISPEEIVEQGLMTRDELNEACRKALVLFEYGQSVAAKHGLLLVDTKYEFGKADDGSILLIDEVHTPDSSRYWIAASYEERLKKGLEPENIDKEFLRLWFSNNCDPYKDKVLPDAPRELVSELAWRYIFLYETITGLKFDLPDTKESMHDRIARNVSQIRMSAQRLRIAQFCQRNLSNQPILLSYGDCANQLHLEKFDLWVIICYYPMETSLV